MVITYRGYNNPVYNAHKNVGVHRTWQNTVVLANFCFAHTNGGGGCRDWFHRHTKILESERKGLCVVKVVQNKVS